MQSMQSKSIAERCLSVSIPTVSQHSVSLSWWDSGSTVHTSPGGTSSLLVSSLVPRPSHCPVFDCLQYAKTEPCSSVAFLWCLCTCDLSKLLMSVPRIPKGTFSLTSQTLQKRERSGELHIQAMSHRNANNWMTQPDLK